jgi:omega-6 fatty acid desaturase (delta-12 desaturase)
MTPFAAWRHMHVTHHAQVGNLDERGTGDIWTLTVREYRTSSLLRRICYRTFRNPLVLFGVGPVLYFALWQRIPPMARSRSVERRSILWTDLAILVALTPLILVSGLGQAIVLHLVLLAGAASIGSWLFYVQHQFEDTYWSTTTGWEFEAAALARLVLLSPAPRAAVVFRGTSASTTCTTTRPGSRTTTWSAPTRASPRFRSRRPWDSGGACAV